jgi:hypothetical protein
MSKELNERIYEAYKRIFLEENNLNYDKKPGKIKQWKNIKWMGGII